jgi:hypothetical protein
VVWNLASVSVFLEQLDALIFYQKITDYFADQGREFKSMSRAT